MADLCPKCFTQGVSGHEIDGNACLRSQLERAAYLRQEAIFRNAEIGASLDMCARELAESKAKVARLRDALVGLDGMLSGSDRLVDPESGICVWHRFAPGDYAMIRTFCLAAAKEAHDG